jgi:hypothetical protein
MLQEAMARSRRRSADFSRGRRQGREAGIPPAWLDVTWHCVVLKARLDHDLCYVAQRRLFGIVAAVVAIAFVVYSLQ